MYSWLIPWNWKQWLHSKTSSWIRPKRLGKEYLWWKGKCVLLISLLFSKQKEQVEGEAQGDSDSLQKFFQHVNKGPRLSHVTKVEKKELPAQEDDGHFGLRRTSESVLDFSTWFLDFVLDWVWIRLFDEWSELLSCSYGWPYELLCLRWDWLMI